MESKTYKELQALAKLHGIKANGTRNALVGKLRDKLGENSSRVDDNEDDKPQGESHESSQDNGGKPRDSIESQMPAINTMDASAPPGPEGPEVATERRKSERLSATKEIIDYAAPTADIPAPAGPAEPVATTERRKSERLSATKMPVDVAARSGIPDGPEGTVVVKGRSERPSATKQVHAETAIDIGRTDMYFASLN